MPAFTRYKIRAFIGENMIRKAKLFVLVLNVLLFCAQAYGSDSMLAVSAIADGVVNFYRVNGDDLVLFKSVPAGHQPSEICLDPNGKRIFVSQPPPEKSIVEIDLKDLNVVAT